MREIVIVIADLFLEPDVAVAPDPSPASGATPRLEYLARFGDEALLPEGWRAWTAQWLDLPQYAHEAPASVAAAGVVDMRADTMVRALDHASVHAPADAPRRARANVPADALADAPRDALADAPAERAVWLATPVHLMAGLTSVHFDRRSILRLPRAELEELAATFANTFRGSGLELHPLEDGELLLSGPPLAAPATTTEPARMLLTPVAGALAAGPGAAALRRLGAEIEMWLHGHPLNAARARRGAPPVTALWLWGGGAPAVPLPASSREITDAAFGSNAYVRGLWRLAGGESRPMPVDWAAVIGEPRAQRALGVVEVAELLQANASWSLADAAVEIDRRWLAPSLAALRRGALERFQLLANDRLLTLRTAHRWRLWRRAGRARRGIEALA